MESTSDLMVVLGAEQELVAVSPTSLRTLGLPASELIGRRIADLVHADDREAFDALLEPTAMPRFRQTGSTEFRFRHRDGRWRWFDVSPADLGERSTPGSAQPERHIALACADITDYRRAQEALAELNRRFRSAFDDAPIGMAITSLSGCFLQVNGALALLLGRTEAELLTMTIQDVTHPEDGPHAERQRSGLLQGARSRQKHETRFVHADGSVVGILHSSSCVAGADGRPSLLIDHVEDITERHAFEARLRQQALHDPLTSLPNRALFMDRLNRALPADGGSGEAGTATAVLFCDLDRFKAINDRYGHHVGDLVLVAVARRVTSVIRHSDTVARLGGDELVILCPDVTAEQASDTAERLRDALRDPVAVGGHSVVVTVSVGIALSGPGRTTPEQMLRDSDDAMYQAKDGGRDRAILHDVEQGDLIRRRVQLRDDLLEAINEGQLRLHYQPQVSLDDGRVLGVEVLVRWEHPRFGLLMPDAFIDVAEESGQMRILGNWVLQEAVRQAAARWHSWPVPGDPAREGEAVESGSPIGPGHPQGVPVTWVNVSASELADPDFAETVERMLRRHDLPAAALGLEITESVLMVNLARVSLTLSRLRALNIQLAIDDFGTGYSSLSYIAQFPVNTLKIDASFIGGLDDPERRRESFAVVTAVIGLAHSLRLMVIAEGIETQSQASILHGLGCDQGQGYLYGRPSPDVALDGAGARHPLSGRSEKRSTNG